ncbi:MAG: hypothetical protein IPL04_08475 [Chitinophagaceae bacterium]|nr:hypothetical protein [Chitinophagaceae bacterium]
MTEQNAIELKEKLLSLGFEGVLTDIDSYKVSNEESFTIFHYMEIEKDQLMYALEIERNQQNKFVFDKYVLGIRHIPVPEIAISGISTKELEIKMMRADKLYNQYLSGNEDTSQNHIIKKQTMS